MPSGMSQLGDGTCPLEFEHYFKMQGAVRSLKRSTPDGKKAVFFHNFDRKEISIKYGFTEEQLNFFVQAQLHRSGHLAELLGFHSDAVNNPVIKG